MQLVILMGGKATRLAPLNSALPKGLMSINNRPAIFNMINPLLDNPVTPVTEIIFIASPANADIIKQFAGKTYGAINYRVVIQPEALGPLDAFMKAEPFINEHTLLLLGDTLCETDLDFTCDWLGYMEIKDESHPRWCLIRTEGDDNRIEEIIDKPDYIPATNKVLVGIYNFTDAVLLKEALKQKYEPVRGELQLSSGIEYYLKRKNMAALLIKEWRDIGTLKDYNDSLLDYIKGNYINRLSVDKNGILTKSCKLGRADADKLCEEARWMEAIQESPLRFVIPQFLGLSCNETQNSYRLEYCGYPALNEYFMYYDIPEGNFSYIFDKLLVFAKNLWGTKPDKEFNLAPLAREMYLTRPHRFLASWKRQDIASAERITVNGEVLLGYNECMEILKDRFEEIINNSKDFAGIMHGDMSFLNILYSPAMSTFKLIDPRGSFGGKAGLYGDIRYDLAKLRYSTHGLNGYLRHDLFKLEESGSLEFNYKYSANKIISHKVFDDALIKHGFNLDDVELIEAITYIGPIVMMSDEHKQIMSFISALKCLNNQVNKMKK